MTKREQVVQDLTDRFNHQISRGNIPAAQAISKALDVAQHCDESQLDRIARASNS